MVHIADRNNYQMLYTFSIRITILNVSFEPYLTDRREMKVAHQSYIGIIRFFLRKKVFEERKLIFLMATNEHCLKIA